MSNGRDGPTRSAACPPLIVFLCGRFRRKTPPPATTGWDMGRACTGEPPREKGRKRSRDKGRWSSPWWGSPFGMARHTGGHLVASAMVDVWVSTV